MDRFAIKLTLLAVAVASAIFWLQPPRPALALSFGVGSALWALLSLAALRWERIESWNYSFVSFFGFLMLTVEAGTGLMGLGSRSGLLWMALLHGVAFVLALAGRYQKAGAGRRRRTDG